MTSRPRPAVLGLAVAGLLVATTACSGASPSPTTPPTSSSPSTAPATTGSEPAGFGAGPPGSGLSRFYQQKVTWSSCQQGDQCADIWVPLDYAHPDGPAITVRMDKRAASDPSQRLGSLFFNPGGPGISGIQNMAYWKPDAPIADRYDLVTFDPRGVGASTPIDCMTDKQLDAYLAFDPSPDNASEVRQMQALFASYVHGCETRSGPLLGHVSTVEVARDMDIMRALVGDPKLNYFGFSYGTLLGADYAGLFPDRVGRMVLDGAIDPEADLLTTQLAVTKGFQTELIKYLQSCVSKGGCPLGSSVPQAQRRLVDFVDGLDSAPLPTAGGRKLTEGLAVIGILIALYSPQFWSTETLALTQALQGNGSTLLAMSDVYTRRNADGTYQDNANEAQTPISCLDSPQHESLAQIEAGASTFDKASPLFGPVGAWFPYPCSNWPLKASEQPPDYAAKGAPPIVVVGTTRDPATPYQQAVNLADDLSSGVLLTRNGDGHTAYQSGNACIDAAIDRYVATGHPPVDGTRC